MKKILITGENSYIGGKFTEWVAQWPEKYSVDEISVREEEWKMTDFSNYDVIIHLAAIVHRKETKENIELYYKVNRDLAYEVALKAKEDGINQFIFMSTMNVYGIDSGIITKDTPCNPKTAYGKSKLEAEQLVNSLQDENFSVAIIRPPMVYGPKTVGNYALLSKLAKISPIFPRINNQRSMIFIYNLTEFIRLLVQNKSYGLFFPQNKFYVKTSDMVKQIADANNKNIYLIKLFNPFIKIFKINLVRKVFGNLTYDKKLSTIGIDYSLISFEESIHITENS